MSTRCMIGMKEGNNVRAIYCHHDGYIEGGVGEQLYRFYDEEDKIKKLLELGNLSSLGNEPVSITVNPDLGCDDYAATEGMEDNAADIYAGETGYFEDTDDWCHYLYLWKDGEWQVANWKKKSFESLKKYFS